MEEREPGSTSKKADTTEKANKKTKEKRDKTEKKEKKQNAKNNNKEHKKDKARKEDKEHKKEKKHKEKKRKRGAEAEEAGAGHKDDAISDEWSPKRDENEDDAEEADLWNSIGEIVEPVTKIENYDITVGTEAAEELGTDEDHVIQVPAEATVHVAEKLVGIGNMVKTATLVMKGSTIRISGEPKPKLRASQYVAAVLDNRVPEGFTDVTTVHVLPEWVDTWTGRKALQEELQVLIIFETLRGRAAFPPGQLAGLPYVKQNSKGEMVERYQPVIVKSMSPGGKKVQATWCFDGNLKDCSLDMLQAAVRVSILGKPPNRAKAVLRILMHADQRAPGLLASQLEALEKTASNSDIFGCNGGPGGLGLQDFELGIDQHVMSRFVRLGGFPDAEGQGNEYLDLVRQVSECSILWLYTRAVGAASSYYQTTRQFLIAVGTRSQRWMAVELIRMMMLVHGNFKTQCLGSLPPKLASDCSMLIIPYQALGSFYGRKNWNYRQLMQDTKTIILPIRELKSSEEMKVDAADVEDFIANMYEVAGGDGQEVAFFGPPLAQRIALMRTFIEIERKVPGFVIRTSPPQEIVDPAEHHGLDKVRLSYDFQEDASSAKAAILSAASGCHVNCLTDLLLVAGDSRARQRAREYAKFMAGKALGKHGKFPTVENGDSRRDMVGIWVHNDVSRSRWFKEKLWIVMKESGLCAFFDQRMNDEGERRLWFAGHKIEDMDDAENNPAMVEVLEKTRSAAEAVVDGRPQKNTNAWWSEWSWQRNKRSWQSTQQESADAQSEPAPKKMDTAETAATSGQGWQSGAPTGPGWDGWNSWDNSKTDTNTTVMDAPDVSPSKTSSWQGEEPSWEGPGWDCWNSWGGGQDWQDRQTVPGSGNGEFWETENSSWLADEENRDKAPMTPAGFGPHGTAAPKTPAPQTQHAAPQTPAGFGPHGSAAPQTPGGPLRSTQSPGSSVPEPATPAPPRSTQSPKPAVPEPATPAPPRSTQGQKPAVPEPATPAPPRSTQGQKPAVPEPATPAPPRSTQGQKPAVPEPATPAPPRSTQGLKPAVPQPATPAAIRSTQGQKPAVPQPATPAAIRSTQGQKPAVPQPATPAAIRSTEGQKPAVPAPATPAALRGTQSQGPDPPAGGTSQGASSVRPAPATPAALKRSSDQANGAGAVAVDNGSTAQPSTEEDLPPGWQKCISKKYGKPYYFNAALKRSQYERPTE